MTNETVTSDLTKFGFRELDMAADLLKAYAANGSDFLTDGVNVFMNTNSGNVFLCDEDMNVGVLERGEGENDIDNKVVQFYSCPQCGNEGTQSEGLEEKWDFEKYEGYCSKECRNKNN